MLFDMNSHFEQAVRDPALVYGSPAEVLKDASLSAKERRRVLESWEADAIRLQASEAEGFMGGERSRLDQVEAALKQLPAGE